MGIRSDISSSGSIIPLAFLACENIDHLEAILGRISHYNLISPLLCLAACEFYVAYWSGAILQTGGEELKQTIV